MPGLTVLNTLRSNSFHTEVDGNQGHQSETHTRRGPKCKSPTAFAAGRLTVWQERLGPDFWPDRPLGIPCHLSGLHMHFHVQRQEFCSERV
jgi:hypothetical protein